MYAVQSDIPSDAVAGPLLSTLHSPLSTLHSHLPEQQLKVFPGGALLVGAAQQIGRVIGHDDFRVAPAVNDAAQFAAALASGSMEALRCCTECHRAGQSAVRGGQLVALAKESCQACHRG